MTGLLRRLAADRRGGIGALSVLVAVVIITAAAAAVDIASLHFRARALQGLADTAAVSAARDPDTAQATVQRILALKRSGATIEGIAVGQYHARSDVPREQRFEVGGASNDAIRVMLQEDVTLFFGSVLGIDAVRIHKRATAVRPAAGAAAFSIGSRLLRVEPAIANALLKGLTGRDISLTAVSYEGLVTSSIDVDDLLNDLGNSLSIGDRDTLLSRTISTRTLIDAMARQTSGQTSVALNGISASLTGDADRNLNLDALIDVDPLARARVDARVPAWDLLAAALGEAAGPTTIDLSSDLDGKVAAARVRLAIGEREQHSPWLTITRDGTTIVRTAQVRLYVDLTTLNLAGLGRLRLPLFVEIASGEASLAAIDCRADAFEVAAKSGVARVWLGDIDPERLNNFSRPLTPDPGAILDTALLRVRAAAQVDVGTSGLKRLRFDREDIEDGAVQSVGSGDILGSTLTSLVAGARLDIQVLGLGIVLPGLPSQLRNALAQVVAPIDDVLDGLLALVGVGLGEADVRPAGLDCRSASAAILAA